MLAGEVRWSRASRRVLVSNCQIHSGQIPASGRRSPANDYGRFLKPRALTAIRAAPQNKKASRGGKNGRPLYVGTRGAIAGWQIPAERVYTAVPPSARGKHPRARRSCRDTHGLAPSKGPDESQKATAKRGNSERAPRSHVSKPSVPPVPFGQLRSRQLPPR